MSYDLHPNFLSSCQDLVTIHNRGSFIGMTFDVVKLKIFKVLRTNSTSMKWPFLGGF